MIRLVCALAGLLAGLVLVPAASAAPGDTARYVLPPGNYGGVPANEDSRDQLPLYDGLTPLRGNVGRDDLRRLFLPMDFRPIGATRREDTGRPGLRLVYDAYGVPHVHGRSRADVMFGAGWAAARDRGLLFTLGRNPARAAVADVPGLDAFGLVTNPGREFVPSAQTERLVDAQRRLIVRTYGREGRQMLRDFRDYAAGANAFFRRNGGGEPNLTANDVIAVTAFIGSIFGAGGGAEHVNADLLAKLRDRLGAQRGSAAWEDVMLATDPESPVTTRRRFDYGPRTGGPVRGSVVPDPDSVELVDVASETPTATPARRQMSNWLLASPQRSATGRSLGVMGPQLGYFYPGIVQQIHLEGPGIKAQGAAVAGLALYILIGRTEDYAWSLTSAGHDNVDVFAERLCEPRGGGEPTRASRHYVFRGRCRPMRTFDAGTLAGRPVRFQRTVHGPVFATATVDGRPYALSRKRSTFGRDGLNLAALKAMTEGRATTPRRFRRIADRFGFTFNWAYQSRDATAFYSSGRLPRRARGLHRMLPTLGTGAYEWRGFLSRREHPQAVGGPRGLLLNWNNRAARGFMHGDDTHHGSVHRVEMFDRWPRRVRLPDVASNMNRAATEDLRATEIWPLIRSVLRTGPAPDEQTRRAAELVDEWSRQGGSRLDRDLDGTIDHPGAAVLDGVERADDPGEYRLGFRSLADAVMEPVFGPLLDDLADVQGRDAVGSFGSGWYSYVDKDLRTLLDRRVRGRFALRYCGGGSLPRCREALWGALKETADALAAEQGPDPAAWRSRRATRTRFVPGLLPDTIRYTNRPAYQQVLELAGRRGR